jgi:DNA-binding MarR family transcriptional regulator/predicted GNAT family acetyltransferase
MSADMVAQVRSFSRVVTERVGALDERFLGRERPLGEARLLWEIGPEGLDVRDLRRRLRLDSGYASRLLRSLESQGLVVVEEAPGDRRVRRARLTTTGLAERAVLDGLADELAAETLEQLDEDERSRLVAAMAETERLLRASLFSIAAEDPASADAAWCIGQYYEELARRFPGGFDPALSLPADRHQLTPPSGLLLLARRGREAVGCGAVLFHDERPAEIKRMWIAPEARGSGLGRRLLRTLEQRARAAGASVLHLETNGELAEAIRLYRAEGYREVAAFSDDPYAQHWFEKRLPERQPRTTR